MVWVDMSTFCHLTVIQIRQVPHLIAEFSLFGSRYPANLFALVVLSSDESTVQAGNPTNCSRRKERSPSETGTGTIPWAWSGPNALISPYSYMIYMELLLQLHHKHT
jgi:hypothetical protein